MTYNDIKIGEQSLGEHSQAPSDLRLDEVPLGFC